MRCRAALWKGNVNRHLLYTAGVSFVGISYNCKLLAQALRSYMTPSTCTLTLYKLTGCTNVTAPPFCFGSFILPVGIPIRVCRNGSLLQVLNKGVRGVLHIYGPLGYQYNLKLASSL